MLVGIEFIDKPRDHRIEGWAFLWENRSHVDVNHQPGDDHACRHEVNDHRPLNKCRSKVKGHYDPGDHDDGNHYIDHQRIQLLSSVICALRRKCLCASVYQPQCADSQPVKIVSVQPDLFAKHFGVKVVPPAEYRIDKEYDHPG